MKQKLRPSPLVVLAPLLNELTVTKATARPDIQQTVSDYVWRHNHVTQVFHWDYGRIRSDRRS